MTEDVGQASTCRVDSPCGNIEVVVTRVNDRPERVSFLSGKSGSCIRSTLQVASELTNQLLESGKDLGDIAGRIRGHTCGRAKFVKNVGDDASCFDCVAWALIRLNGGGNGVSKT